MTVTKENNLGQNRIMESINTKNYSRPLIYPIMAENEKKLPRVFSVRAKDA